MADTATTRKRLRKQSLGSNTNTWGETKLNEVLDAIDQSMDGYLAIALTGDLTLATTNYDVNDQAKRRIHNFTGTLSSAATVTYPSVEGWYIVLNNAGAQVTVKCSGGVGVAIPAGYIAMVYSDGTDLYNAAPSLLPGLSAAVASATASAASASTNATTAIAQAASATASAASASASYITFNDAYLGQKSSDPALDNYGGVLLVGAMYWNTVSQAMKVWNGSTWQIFSATGPAGLSAQISDAAGNTLATYSNFSTWGL